MAAYEQLCQALRQPGVAVGGRQWDPAGVPLVSESGECPHRNLEVGGRLRLQVCVATAALPPAAEDVDGISQGAQPMPSHCPPDNKRQPRWHL